ncbi:OB-fold nucleic acid binding domain-containing protein [Acetobacter sp. TBRC 12305]|uniref:OB-fold nucleic acid binding domain-containing protein n=2 Tax=Acetobacter garciniae TaxID=2817435 RepID=A0A939HMN3_9PROT|nr:OB-fold nucleic acid binding domain-containing protein [Acetobacter garciniae]MBX0344627.1 OB-fold nucleic acid binding domain-containing protein [Acetobacter garciniae]
MRHLSFFCAAPLAAVLAFSTAVAAPAHRRVVSPQIETAPPAAAAPQHSTQGVYDLSPLPVFTGKIEQFLPSSHGGIIGFILTDGTQVFVSVAEGHSFAGLIKPGDTVQISGLKGVGLPIIRAFEVTSPRGRSVQDNFISMPLHSTEMISGPDLVQHGEVWMPLYSVGGKLTGAVLKDHSVIYLSTAEAARVANLLQPGQMLYAVGTGSSGELGTAIDAREIGPSADKLVSVTVGEAPPPGPPAGSAGYDVIPGAGDH